MELFERIFRVIGSTGIGIGLYCLFAELHLVAFINVERLYE